MKNEVLKGTYTLFIDMHIDFTLDFGKYMFEIYLCACIIYLIL